MKQLYRQASRGYILLLSLIVSGVVMAVTTGFFNYFASSVHTERYALASARALAIAEAGIDTAIYKLNQDSGYSGENDTTLDDGVFTISISSIDGNTKRITATGSVPNSENPTAVKEVQATANINATTVSFRYGVQVGEGGVSLNNGSRIMGNLFANGDVSGSGTITGDATVAASTDSVADQQWTVQNNSTNIGDASARADIAQSFQPAVTSSLTKLSLFIKKLGNPGDITIKIVTDNSGKPSTTVLASGTIPASLVTASYGFIDATLGSSPALSTNHTYWIIAIASVNANNYFIWGRDSSGGYTVGAAKSSSNWNAQNPSWSSITGDLDFKTYMGAAPSVLSGVTVQGNAWAPSLLNCSVGGTASYQTISGCSVTGTRYPGVPSATPVPLPISDAQIADWETVAAAGGTIAGPYSFSGTQTLGPKKINGDLTVSNNATLILSGPIWVNGNISFSNNASLLVASSVGQNGAVLIADAMGATATKGRVDISNNVVIHGNGNINSFPMIISTNTSSEEAIKLENNASGVILYAPYGGIEISNGTSATQVTARRLELENNASISYTSGLQNASFSNGPGGSWEIVPGTYAITR